MAEISNTGKEPLNKLNEDERFLYKMLKGLPVEITINSTLLELAEKLGSRLKLDNEHEEKKKVAPNWHDALTLWIEEINTEYLGLKEVPSISGTRSYRARPAVYSAYSDITAGKNKALHEYVDKLVIPLKRSTEKHFDSDALNDLALGVALAYKFPILKTELASLEKDESIPLKEKIIWNGNPSQLGHIIAELHGKGYIEFPTARSINQIAQVVAGIFDARNNKGEIGALSISTLAKEISPKGNSLTPDNSVRWKIPNKDKPL